MLIFRKSFSSELSNHIISVGTINEHYNRSFHSFMVFKSFGHVYPISKRICHWAPVLTSRLSTCTPSHCKIVHDTASIPSLQSQEQHTGEQQHLTQTGTQVHGTVSGDVICIDRNLERPLLPSKRVLNVTDISSCVVLCHLGDEKSGTVRFLFNRGSLGIWLNDLVVFQPRDVRFGVSEGITT